MENKIKISQLPLETTLKEDALIPIVQDNNTKVIKSKDLLKEVDSEISKIDQNIDKLSNDVKEILKNGTTTEVLRNTTETYIQEKIDDGTIANLTIKDGSITENKLSANFLDKFMGESNPIISNEMVYADRIAPLSANTYFGINKPINGNRIVKLSIQGKSNGVVNIAVFELLSATQINVTSINSFNVVVGRNDFDVDILLNSNKDNYIAIEGVGTYSMSSDGYTFSQISKSNMQLGTVTSKFGTNNPMLVGVGIEVSKGGTREPMTDILRRDVDKNSNDISNNSTDISTLKSDIDSLKNNSITSKIQFDMIKKWRF